VNIPVEHAITIYTHTWFIWNLVTYLLLKKVINNRVRKKTLTI